MCTLDSRNSVENLLTLFSHIAVTAPLILATWLRTTQPLLIKLSFARCYLWPEQEHFSALTGPLVSPFHEWPAEK